jgi:EAL domain-containing protein (putative c-di-GMP-specific phosphodiesterase class I)
MRIADAFLGSRLARVWVLLPAIPGATELLVRLSRDGWEGPRNFCSLGELRDALSAGEPPPDALITRIRLPDGDAFELIRHLGALPAAPAVYLVSRQARAVVKTAQALCELHRIRLLGHSVLPLEVDRMLQALEALRLGNQDARTAAPPPAEPDIAQLEGIVLEERVRTYLQPKLRLSSGQIVGFEALMRAVSSDGRMLGAPQIIEPLARAGLLPAATLQVFNQTVAFLRSCLADGIGVGASVNVPLSLLSDPWFYEYIVNLVQAEGLDPSWLTLEITETEAMADPAEVIENAARIRMFGFNLSIDDFGTAYSSFAQLTKIPFSELKIERSFICGIESDPAKEAVVAACALLGRRLGLHVVAEGVETMAELAAVRAAGCSDIQGYLLSRPMPIDEAGAWLRLLEDQHFPVADEAELDSWVPGL